MRTLLDANILVSVLIAVLLTGIMLSVLSSDDSNQTSNSSSLIMSTLIQNESDNYIYTLCKLLKDSTLHYGVCRLFCSPMRSEFEMPQRACYIKLKKNDS